MSQNTTKTQTEQTSDFEKLKAARNSSRQEILDKMYDQPKIEWLTENSRKFLESGYLTEGATPEGRIREIFQ